MTGETADACFAPLRISAEKVPVAQTRLLSNKWVIAAPQSEVDRQTQFVTVLMHGRCQDLKSFHQLQGCRFHTAVSCPTC